MVYLDAPMFWKSILPLLIHLILELEGTVLKISLVFFNDLWPWSSVKHVINLCGTNNLYEDPPYEIVDGIIAAASVLEKKYNDPKIIVFALLPRDESWSKNQIIIKEINELLN